MVILPHERVRKDTWFSPLSEAMKAMSVCREQRPVVIRRGAVRSTYCKKTPDLLVYWTRNIIISSAAILAFRSAPVLVLYTVCVYLTYHVPKSQPAQEFDFQTFQKSDVYSAVSWDDLICDKFQEAKKS